MSKNYSDETYYTHKPPQNSETKSDGDISIPTNTKSGSSVKYVRWELQTDVGRRPTLSHSKKLVNGSRAVNVSGCGDPRFNGDYVMDVRDDGTVRFEKHGAAKDEPVVIIEPKANTPLELLKDKMRETQAKKAALAGYGECLNWLKLAENFGFTPLHIAVMVAIKDLQDAKVSSTIHGDMQCLVDSRSTTPRSRLNPRVGNL